MMFSRLKNDSQAIALFAIRWHLHGMKTGHREPSRQRHRLCTLILAAILPFCGVALSSQPSAATQLSAKTAQAFDQYIRAKEARENGDLAAPDNFLWIDSLAPAQRAQAYDRLRKGQILVQRDPQCASSNCTSIPGGLIHDWIGVVFVPRVSIAQALSTLQDYDRDAEYYQPEVLQSKLLERSGDDFRVFLRLKRVQVVTVVLDTEYDVHYTRLDAGRVYSRSHSTRIAEVDDPGKPSEHDESPDGGHGFLWRLDSYWRFHQADGGVYIQCDAVSLTRDVPAGLGWLIRSFIERIPSESLHSTLAETRSALLAQSNRSQEKSQ